MDNNDIDRALKAKEVERLSGFDRMTIYRKAREGLIPGLIRFGPKTIRFRESAIRKWLSGK